MLLFFLLFKLTLNDDTKCDIKGGDILSYEKAKSCLTSIAV